MLDADWKLDSDGLSDIDMQYGHQGGRHDLIAGLVHFRHRDLDTSLGRWVRQDPMGYVDGSSLYTYVNENPVIHIDPTGEALNVKIKAAIGRILGKGKEKVITKPAAKKIVKEINDSANDAVKARNAARLQELKKKVNNFDKGQNKFFNQWIGTNLQGGKPLGPLPSGLKPSTVKTYLELLREQLRNGHGDKTGIIKERISRIEDAIRRGLLD